ncbi:uncharacterized protein LOC125946222 [Dermacentor silvarum]|uniref:uncharacterized protein LOC125946222 n=1 Tax=Dermacentor silvarum TaxID=543639 RepID=UPI002100BCFD|nr:uncharacterized protein LOC125946222 [Dermacentor silvarum]
MPTYLLNEELVAFESELRFERRIEQNEQKLKKFLQIASKILKFPEPSYIALEAYLRPRLAKHALITATPPSDHIGPCIVWGERRHLICGCGHEIIDISPDTSLE